MVERDHETRARLLDAAAHLFAERGFARVTVRDICRAARANVAAVNYHFRGKDGLYTAVMQSAIGTMQSTTEAARLAGEREDPEGQLRAYIRVFIERVAGSGRNTWIHQLIMREISEPTPALDMVVQQVLQPRMTYICGIISALVDSSPDDPCVVRSAMSVQTQFHALSWGQVMGKLAPEIETKAGLDAMTEHIMEFSIGGIRATNSRARSEMAKPPKTTTRDAAPAGGRPRRPGGRRLPAASRRGGHDYRRAR